MTVGDADACGFSDNSGCAGCVDENYVDNAYFGSDVSYVQLPDDVYQDACGMFIHVKTS